MRGKTLLPLLILALTVIQLMMHEASCRSPLQFSGRSLLSKEQREALLKIVQGEDGAVEDSQTNVTKKVHSKKNSFLTRDHTQAGGGSHSIDNNELDSEGCMKKVVMVEEVEFDTEVKCTHVFQESCFESYTTSFKRTKAEECDESFKKECEIEYFKVPKEEKVQICNEMLNRDCGAPGNRVCSKEYETVCETIYEEHEIEEQVADCTTKLVEKCMVDDYGEKWCDNIPQRDCKIKDQKNTKLTPKTECRKEMAEVCGPEACPLVKGDRICRDEIKTVIQEVPQESCNMRPRKVCNLVSKVVPMLEPVKHCIEIPKEVCAKSRINPVRRKKPVVRRWCLNDNDNSDNDSDGRIGDDVVYVLSEIGEWSSADKIANMKAQIVDLKTGKEMCSREFSYGSLLSSAFSDFALLGPDRRLAYCGGEMDGNCYQLDPKVNGKEAFISDEGPLYSKHASLVNNNHQKWLFIGAEQQLEIAAGIEGDLSQATVTESTLFSEDELTYDGTGNSALVAFEVGGNPGDKAIFYIHALDNTNSLRVIVKYGEHSADLIVTGLDVGTSSATSGVDVFNNAVCGHAVDDQGWTQVYCFAVDQSLILPHMLVFPIDTSSPDNLKSQLNNYELSVEDTALQPLMDSTLPDLSLYGHSLGDRRVGVTVPLKEKHLSLFINSQNKKSFVFNANDKALSLYNKEAEVEWGTNVLYATEAYKKDMVNLGCADLPIGDDIAYVLSWAGDSLSGTDDSIAKLRAQIVDFKDGSELCRADFEYEAVAKPDGSPELFASPGESSFSLVGPKRQLAFCGGVTDGKCYFVDQQNNGKRTFIQQNGPEVYNHASIITSVGQWLFLGFGSNVAEVKSVDTSANADLSQVKFIDVEDYLGTGTDIGQLGGYRALVELPAMDDDGSTPMVYIQGNGQNTVRFLVKYLEYKLETTFYMSDITDPLVEKMNIGPNPVCGSALDSAGKSQIYCLAYFSDTILGALLFPVDTSSEGNLIAEFGRVEPYFIHTITSLDGLDEVIEDKLLSYQRRAATVFPMTEKHLSLIIPGGSKKSFAFNAKTRQITEHTALANEEWGSSVLYATKALRRDKANLECRENV